MYRVTGSPETFADLSEAIGAAVSVVMKTPANESTVRFTSSMRGEDRNLYTVKATPTRRLSIINLF